MLATSLVACSGDSGLDGPVAHARIGPDGGLLTSYDSVVTLAFVPGALDSTIDFFIEPSDAPPEVYGPAYRVDPNPNLLAPITVSYRFDLPMERAAIVATDPVEYNSGNARWNVLPRIDVEDKLIKAKDTQVSLFYALLDDGPLLSDDDGTTGSADDDGGVGVGVSGNLDEGPADDEGGSSKSTGGPPAGPCDPFGGFMGPYTVETFAQLGGQGAEDLGFSPDRGVFAAMVDDRVVLIDPDGTVTPFSDPLPLSPGGITTGTRFMLDGDIVVGGFDDDILWRVDGDNGMVSVLAMPEELDGPNQVYVGPDGILWVASFFSGDLLLIDPDDGSTEVFLAGASPEPNGMFLDTSRNMVFWTSSQQTQLFRASYNPTDNSLVAGSNEIVTPTLGDPLIGFLDGMTMDSCGNLYVMDEGMQGNNPSRIYRIFLDEAGYGIYNELVVGEGAATQFPGLQLSNVAFGQGTDWESYNQTMFVIGIPGNVYTIDMQIDGAPTAASGF